MSVNRDTMGGSLLAEASALLAAGRGEEAVDAFKRALQACDTDADTHYGLGSAYRKIGKDDLAATSFERAVALRHDHVAALVALGDARASLGQAEDASDSYQLALAFDRGCVDARIGLGGLYFRANRSAEAADELRAAALQEPLNAAAWFGLARALSQGGDESGAIAAYRRAIAAKPDYGEAYVNLGVSLVLHRGEAAAAEVLLRRALELDSSEHPVWLNLGLALQEQGRFGEAFELFETALAKWPGNGELRWHRGVARLLSGDLERGWDDHEARKEIQGGAFHRRFPFAEWQGEPVAGRGLLVYGEQGVGDEIMFASCLQDVIGSGARCVVECNPKLERLFQRSFPEARVVGHERDGERVWLGHHPEIAVQSAIGSLPRFLRRRREQFPQHGGYLKADPERVEQRRAWLAALGPGVSVGICWRGGGARTKSALRSAPLQQWRALFEQTGVQFVSLQYGNAAEDLSALAGAGRTVVHRSEAVEDLDETAALIAALDLVITVDNTVAHLTGALGRPLWLLLPASPDWRWFWDGGRSPWYPSARLFRQLQPGAWEAVFDRLAAELRSTTES